VGKLKHDGLDGVTQLEFDLVSVIVGMEAAGMAVDQAKLREIETRAKAQGAEHAAMLHNKLGDSRLNPGSPQQLHEGKACGSSKNGS